jgi:hypothetical protein
MKKPVFQLAAAIRMYQSQYDLAVYKLDRLIQQRQEEERRRDHTSTSMGLELARLSGPAESQGNDLQRYHLMRLAAQLVYERAAARLETLDQQILGARADLSALRQRLRMLELLKDKQEEDWNLQVERELEAESSYLHLIRNYSGRSV